MDTLFRLKASLERRCNYLNTLVQIGPNNAYKPGILGELIYTQSMLNTVTMAIRQEEKGNTHV